MKTNSFLFLLLIITTISYSQKKVDFVTSSTSQVYDGYSNADEWDYRKRDAITEMRNNSGRVLSDYEYEEIIGNSYFNKSFLPGYIYSSNKIISKESLLRYNAFKDEIEISKNLDFEILLKHRDISCTIADKKYMYAPFIKKEGSKFQNGYFNVIYEGNKYSLLFREIKIYKEAKVAKNSMTSSFPAKLVESRDFYFMDKSDDHAMIINSNKKKLLKNINPKYSKEIGDYIKKNNLNLKEKEDLISLFKYYDALTNSSI